MLPKLSKSAQIALKKRKRALCRKIETALKSAQRMHALYVPTLPLKANKG